MTKFKQGHPIRGQQTQVVWVKIGHFQLITRYNSKTVQDMAQFLLKSNRKSCMLYQMVMLPMSLGDP